jgi:hypothetical protein
MRRGEAEKEKEKGRRREGHEKKAREREAPLAHPLVDESSSPLRGAFVSGPSLGEHHDGSNWTESGPTMHQPGDRGVSGLRDVRRLHGVYISLFIFHCFHPAWVQGGATMKSDGPGGCPSRANPRLGAIQTSCKARYSSGTTEYGGIVTNSRPLQVEYAGR